MNKQYKQQLDQIDENTKNNHQSISLNDKNEILSKQKNEKIKQKQQEKEKKQIEKKRKLMKKQIELWITSIITFIIIILPVVILLLLAIPKAPPPVDHQPTDDYFNVLHISDIHLSKFDKEASQNRLKEFCNLLPVMKPDAVVVSGDIVHSRINSYLPFKLEEEYKMYDEIVTECLQQYNTTWYDVRGNHDGDGLYGLDDPRNYAKEYFKGNSQFTGVGYVDVTKNNKTLRIIGMDMNTEAILSSEGEGFVPSKHVDEIVSYVNEANSYHLLVGHNDLNKVMTEKRKYVNDELEKRLGDEKNLTAYFCGHIHSKNISSYSNGFVTSKVHWLIGNIYKQTVFKNNRLYTQQLGFNEIPIVPICPADYSANCKYTEVVVGYEVSKVFVITSNGTEIELKEDEHQRKIWKSDIICNDKSFSIVVEKDGMNHTRHINVNEQFTNINAIQLNIRMSKLLLSIEITITLLVVFRLINGLIAKYCDKWRKVALFELYSHLTDYEILSSLFLIIIFMFVPFVIGTNNIINDGKQVFFFASLLGCQIGSYHTNFMTFSLGLYGMIVCGLWLQNWSLCQYRIKHFWRTMFGLVFLSAFIIVYAILIMKSTSWLSFFTSPLTYLLLEMFFYCWFNAAEIRKRTRHCFYILRNKTIIKNHKKNQQQMNQLIGESETFDLIESNDDVINDDLVVNENQNNEIIVQIQSQQTIENEKEDHITIELEREQEVTDNDQPTNDQQTQNV